MYRGIAKMVLFIIIACLMFKIQSMSLSVLNYQLEKVQGIAQFRNLCISISMIIDDIINIMKCVFHDINLHGFLRLTVFCHL